MAQHTLNAQIIVSGEEDGSLTKLGNKLQEMGSQIQGISNAAMDFLKDSTQTYRDYEDGILETRSVLQSTYSNTISFEQDMQKIEKAAQNWAESTIFTTDDVANAIADAAHAGWDYNKIMEGMPQAMLIAQAGNLELADGVDYLTKMLAATGTQFSESNGFVNEWAKAADLAATDIEEMGEAFLKLGTASQLADTNEELFTMMSVLANAGTTGSAAGTAIRNVMARIAAPTSKAEEAMEALGISEEEAQEALDGLDDTSTEAYKRLEEMGFSAYDTEGNLRPFMDILQDMNILLSDMDEKSKNDFLKQLFGTKSFQYAMSLLKSANDGSLMSIYDAILGVRDTDYAEQKKETLMSGLSGAIELMESKLQEFKRKVGEVFSGPLESLIGQADTFIDGLNSLDPAILTGITDALGVIAISAPALMGIGTVLKIIGTLKVGNGFAWMAAAAGIAGVATAIEKLTGFESHFGNVTLETQQITDYLDSIVTPYTSHAEDIKTALETVETSKQTYLDTLTNFWGQFKTDQLTGETTMDESAYQQYMADGKAMYDALMEGFEASKKGHLLTLNDLFDSDGDGTVSEDEMSDEDYGIYSSMFDSEIDLWEKAETDVTQAINDYYDAVNKAASEGWTGESVQAIEEAIDKLNEAQTRLSEYNADVNIAKALHESETVSWDTINDTISQFEGYRDEAIAEKQNEVYSEMASQYGAYKEKYGTDKSMEWWLANTDEGKLLEEGLARNVEAINNDWGSRINSMIGQLIPEEYQDAFNFLSWISGENGAQYHGADELGSDYVSRYGQQLNASYYKKNGWDLYNTDDPNGLYQMTMAMLNSPIGRSLMGTGLYNSDLISEVLTGAYNRTYDDTGWVGDTTLADAIEDQTGSGFLSGVLNFIDGIKPFLEPTWAEVVSGFEALGNGLLNTGSSALESLSNTGSSGLSKLMTFLGNLDAFFKNGGTEVAPFGGDRSFMPEGEAEPVSYDQDTVIDGIESAGSAISSAADSTTSWISSALNSVDSFLGSIFGGSAEAEEAANVGMSVTDNGSAETAKSQIETVFADDIDQGIHVTDNGSASSVRSSIESQFSSTITQNVTVRRSGSYGVNLIGYAEGGRATEASIFGEAGVAEWAIPEQHTERTAELLASAAEASGFTWSELLTRNGGLNAGSSGATTIIYSPTINAGSSDGIEKALRDDKDRLDRWWRERNMVNANAAYA